MSSQKKEKLLIENLLSSREAYARCAGIVKAEYFDSPEYRPAIKFIGEYYTKYSNLPSVDTVNAEFDLGLTSKTITLDQYKYTCDEVEQFCKEGALINCINDSFEHIEKGERDLFYKKVQDAMLVSLQRDLGIELYDNPQEYLKSLLTTAVNFSTGIKCLDDKLDGGLARQTLTMFSANSGVGKSNMLVNLAVNYSLYGFNVVYISLELPQDMLYIRAAAIHTDINIQTWRQKIPQIAGKLINTKQNGAGSFTIKRMAGSSSPNDIRSYLRHYEMEFNRRPDVIIIDYLDLMYPNGGIKNKGIFEQDKEKSEELTELLVNYNAIGITASQQNREALRMASPDQAVIAGGISKVNTVHNYISLSMTDEMSNKGEMIAYFLKTRTSSGKGDSVLLSFDANTLRITDSGREPASVVQTFVNNNPNRRGGSPVVSKRVHDIIGNTKGGGMPQPKKLERRERIDPETGEITIQEVGSITFNPLGDPLLDCMKTFGEL